MNLEQLWAAALVIGLVLAYVGFFSPRKGINTPVTLGEKYGLAEGESIKKLWHGEYDWRFLGKGTAFWGGHFALQSLVLILTDRDRLILIKQSRHKEPLVWSKGELRNVRIFKSNEGELMGPNGSLEPADIVELEMADAQVLRVRVPRSAVQVFHEFCS